MTPATLDQFTVGRRYEILPGQGLAEAVLAVSLSQTDSEVFSVLREVEQLGWQLAPDLWSRLAGNLHHIGLRPRAAARPVAA